MNASTLRAAAWNIAARLHTGDSHRHAPARADPVEQRADHQQADAVAELEGGNDVAVVDLAPAEVLLDHRLEHAQDLAVDVVDGDDEEQQCADRPAVAPARAQNRFAHSGTDRPIR